MVYFLAGVIAGGFVCLRIGEWWTLWRLSQSETNTRRYRVRHWRQGG